MTIWGRVGSRNPKFLTAWFKDGPYNFPIRLHESGAGKQLKIDAQITCETLKSGLTKSATYLLDPKQE